MANNWYKLDNAAKIFPAIRTKDNVSTFRLAAIFYTEIDKDLLLKALLEALKRFSTFKVKLKKGLFWYYLEYNNALPIIEEEISNSFHDKIFFHNNDYLFKLSYFGKRVSLVIFHSLTDGTGGMEFFKCICYYYLTFSGVEITNDGTILTTDMETLAIEDDDSFLENYNKDINPYEKEERAFTLTGKYYSKGYTALIHYLIKIDKLKEVCKKYDTTITEYIGAVILYAIYVEYFKKKKQETTKPVKLFIPVNLRKCFNSKTLRNFALFVRVTVNMNEELIFTDLIKFTKTQIRDELDQDKLKSRLVKNVNFEKLFIIRILPLALKKIGMMIGYKKLGRDVNTVCFSNLGIIQTPIEMNKYIDRFEFTIGASKNVPVSFSIASYNNTLCLMYASQFINRNIAKIVASKFVEDSLDIVVEANELEVK